jgi:nucleoid DNA-binding protein/LysM repeat protein
MSNKLSIQDLASAYAEKSGTDQKSALAFVKTVFEIVEEFISTDKVVKIKGFGTFKLISVSDRESVNVNTGERIVIAGHTKLSFTPDATLRDAVNRPFADFETTPINENTSIEAMEKLPSYNEALPSEDSSEDYAEDQNLVVVEETVLEEPSSPESPTSYDESVETVASAKDERVGEDLQVETKEEAMPVETNDEAMPVETKEEVLPVIPVHKPNDDNPSYPMAEEPIADPVPGKAGKSHAWLYTIITLLLMAVSYVGGHYQILNNISIDLYTETHSDAPQEKETSPEETDNALPSEEMADTLQNDTSAVDSTLAPSPAVPAAPQEDPAEIAKYFPQVPGGEYWIVGDAGYVHHMQVGETLYRIARKELGDQNLVRYLIVFNKFEDPNIIHTGDPIRIPKLVKKEQKESAQASAE